jgi:hypothetical protein
VLRRGHLSDRALIELCMTGERPAHVDRCDICAERAVELGRWLDDVRTVGREEADAAFPPERLAAQQAQILRRLEQIDRPARVIAFPSHTREERLVLGGGGIRPAWIGIAAAAGIVLGLLGGQLGGLVARHATTARTPIQVQQPADPSQSPSVQTAAYQVPQALSEFDATDTVSIDAIYAIDQLIPRATNATLPVGTVR